MSIVELHDAHVVALKERIYSDLSDASKDARGFRHRIPREQFDAMSVAELDELCTYFFEECQRAAEYERWENEENERKYEKSIQTFISNGAPNRETAIRWLFQCDPIDEEWGIESWLYQHGVSSSEKVRDELYKLGYGPDFY